MLVAGAGCPQRRGSWGHRCPLISGGREVWWLALRGPRGWPGRGDPTAPGAPQGSSRQRSDAVGERGGGRWRQVGAGPLRVEEAGVEAAARRIHLQPCVGESKCRWAWGTLHGHPPSHPPSRTSPGSAPGTWGGGGRGGPRGVSCCAGGTGLGIGEESPCWEVKRERWPQVLVKLSGNGISWARIRQARAGTLARSC